MRENLSDAELNVARLGKELGLSESSLRRKLQESGGVTPADLIRTERLKAARNLIASGRVGSVAEAANTVGFLNVGHFSRLYQKAFGDSPKTHLKEGSAPVVAE